MIQKHLTQVVFWSALLLSVVSVGLVFTLVEPYGWIGIAVIAASILFNLWSVRRSENSGFIVSREHRRAYEPARRFNMVQVFIVFGVVMVQCCIGAYALIA
jgi:4-hydroxybenzoate polyprenyltransferase